MVKYWQKLILTTLDDDEKVKAMTSQILATPHHRASSDVNPQHQHCPTSSKSWCGWQRDKPNATSTYEHDPIPKTVFDCILPVFKRLSNGELLRRCLHGGTQNRNESFHNMAWNIVPTAHFQKHQSFDTSEYFAVCLWNNGASVISELLQSMGIEPGNHTEIALKAEDATHLSIAKYRARDDTKRRRVMLRNKKEEVL